MFDKMLNQPFQVDMEENISTIEQRVLTLYMLKNGKASGEDEIIAELLNKGGNDLIVQLKWLINIIWGQEEIPTRWLVSVLCSNHKKGDAMVCQNYRRITLLNTSYKIVSNIIFSRIKQYSKEIIGEYQSGFMPGKSTVDQIHR